MRRRDETLPPTSAGLLRYYLEEGRGFKISPKSVLAFTIAVMLFEVLLRFWGKTLLGF